MTPQLFVKLTSQIARQTPELADYEAEIADRNIKSLNLQPGIDAAQAALDDATATLQALQALQARPENAPEDWQAPDTTAEQAAVDAAQAALDAAKAPQDKINSERDELQGRANALKAAVAQCQEALDAEPVQQSSIDAWLAEQAAAADGRRIAALWQAAHDYEVAQVSGSAIGLLAMGVMAGKPKCIAVQAWIKSIWALYYTRKATGSTDSDYSGCGQIPHSVPELMDELGL